MSLSPLLIVKRQSFLMFWLLFTGNPCKIRLEITTQISSPKKINQKRETHRVVCHSDTQSKKLESSEKNETE